MHAEYFSLGSSFVSSEEMLGKPTKPEVDVPKLQGHGVPRRVMSSVWYRSSVKYVLLILVGNLHMCKSSIVDEWSRCGLHHYHTTVAFGSAFDAQTHCQLCGGEDGPLCPDGQWERVSCTPTTDRECTVCSDCIGDDNVVLTVCNATHDVVCGIDSSLANNGTDTAVTDFASNNQASGSSLVTVAGIALVLLALLGLIIFWRSRRAGLKYSEEYCGPMLCIVL